MKNKKLAIIILTVAIAGMGAGLLLLSTNLIMANAQKSFESSGDIVDVQEGVESTEKLAEEASGIELPTGGLSEEEIEMLQNTLLVALEEREEGYEVSIATAEFVYYGQNVSIKDDMVEKETAIEAGHTIMDFIFDYVDKTILTPYGIDKTAYTYDIQRQDVENKGQCYGVFLKKGGNIECTIGVCLDNGIEMDAFARDGLIDLYGSLENPIPEEYLVENWCNDTQKKEEIYDAYYESSKEIIENVLGLASIDTSFRDVSKDSCFRASDEWSTVAFGYRLKDGTEITVFYNRINQMWDGFCIQ